MAIAQPTERHEEIQFRQLLEEAVTKPGTLMKAYSMFWNYSLGNQILALIQANNRGITLGPIASFNRWKELGRYVKKGQKRLSFACR
jgi:N-terminal domain of anti-restriction factor ArdC